MIFRKKVILFAVMLFSLTISAAISATEPLPPELIALSSPAGTKLFSHSNVPGYFWPLDLQFVTQDNLTYCGVASSVMVLNALDVTAPDDPVYAPYKIFTQDNFFTPAVEKIMPSSLVKKQGATLDQIGQALATFPVTIKIVHTNESSVDQFRDLAKKTITAQKGYVIVNFARAGLGEKGSGHLSPLAAYDKNSDRFLMLDVARYRYPSVWVKTQALWNAMNTMDKDANAYRGFLIVSKNK